MATDYCKECTNCTHPKIWVSQNGQTSEHICAYWCEYAIRKDVTEANQAQKMLKMKQHMAQKGEQNYERFSTRSKGVSNKTR